MSAPSPEAFEAAKASFFAGLACLEAGRADEAERHFIAALERVPGRVSTLVNLAATRLRLGRPQEALADADAVLAVEPDNHDAWLHRATALGLLGRWSDALAGFERALALDGRQPEVWSRHAQTLTALNRRAEALASYERALALDPTLAGVWSRYGDILREAQRLDDAAHAFRKAIEHGGDPQLHAYFLASVAGGEATPMPPTAPRSYVLGLFDSYADDFEDHLVGQLGYRAHEVLTRHLASLGRAPYASALDLGCGTGLCGPLLRPAVQRLAGVDMSGPMLAKARALGVYDELVQAELIEHLNTTEQRHDLVLAADVFIYVGDLAPVFAAVRRATRPGAEFCFSIELGADAGPEVQLLPSLRYAHSEHHVRRLAAEYGFEVVGWLRQPLREDQRRAVEGLYGYLVKGPKPEQDS